MKYTHISRALSMPVSASNSFQLQICSNGARVMGNSIRRPCYPPWRAVRDLRLHPLAAHTGVGQSRQEFVVQPDGFVDLLADFLPGLDVVRREPTADAFRLDVGVELVVSPGPWSNKR
jgi:hypothetical protein